MEPITMMALVFGARALSKWIGSGGGQQAIESVARIATLAWQTVSTWLSGNRVSVGDSGSLIKERLANGNYRVVCGVFNTAGSQRQQNVWECSDLDSDLQRRFAGKNKITVDL